MKILKKQLKAAMKDEKMAPIDYRKLKKNLKKKSDKKVISKIIKQEQSHLRKLKKIVKRGK